MGTRGRKSSAELTIRAMSSVETIQRPDAPYDLTDEEADEWRAVVDRMPADYFPRETHAVLGQYCRHVVASRRVAQLISQATSDEEVDVDRLDKLYKMQEREGRAFSALAQRMRLTQQTNVRVEHARKPSMVKKPWEA